MTAGVYTLQIFLKQNPQPYVEIIIEIITHIWFLFKRIMYPPLLHVRAQQSLELVAAAFLHKPPTASTH